MRKSSSYHLAYIHQPIDPALRLIVHLEALERLEAIPESKLDWPALGSLAYHRDCIRLISEEINGSARESN